ncbi:MAG: NUDIX hydrolase [Pseudomonadales bacterium]|uniref:Phosphatase NudJ n=1 Tax=Oleiphilus messinensis TaxID=141451 RepID=A0A1Y0I7C3_9GAMM|nr:NUDIX hydrolase [Oleiphilus messinensis]ARU56130.1 bifunctional thiamin pyrimidine pyrophosphate hydrolase and thiamin pyrophosphate hydrolase [Oleiphilus messinensis]MCG8613400.1 NUDIX hydrolase [Pseudomonadales bacterium]
MIWMPHATVAVICEKKGEFLLVEETSEGQTVINQPAGHIEEHERIIDAVHRETLEETGWTIHVENFLGIYTYRAPSNRQTYYRFCFIAEALEQVSEQYDTGIIGPRWLDYERLTKDSERLRSPLVLRCIDDYLAGKRYPLSVIDDFAATQLA